MADTTKKRFHGIDELRGAAMLLVLVYHFLWALSLNGYAVDPNKPALFWIGRIGALLFVSISGVSCMYTRAPYKRAIKILACAVIVWAATAVTGFVEPITFGVLHMLGCCSLIYAAARRPLAKINPIAGAAVALWLFVGCYNIAEGSVFGFDLPSALYSTKYLFWLGFPEASYRSGDYFPLLPWLFLFLFGYFLWRAVGETKAAETLAKRRSRPLAFVGRHTLEIYLVHQPLFFGLLWLVGPIKS